MFHSDTLKQIHEAAVKAAGVVIHAIPGDPRRVIMAQGGDREVVAIPPPVRSHKADDLGSLVALAVRFGGNGLWPVIWYRQDKVVLVVDDSDRRDTVTVALLPTPQIQLLAKLEQEKPAFDQARFIKLLRLELGLDAVLVVNKFRKLSWNSCEDANGNVQRGRESLGAAIEAQVRGVDELPEELVIPVPIFRNQGLTDTYDVRCAVEIDVRNKVFQLVPLPGELDRAIHAAEDAVKVQIDEMIESHQDQAKTVADVVEIAVLHGSPS